MRPPVMVVTHVSGNDAPEMTLVQGDNMIETVASQCANEPFDKRILPRTSRRAEDFLDAHRVNPLAKLPTVDRVAIA